MQIKEEWHPQGMSKFVLQTEEADIYISKSEMQSFIHNLNDHIRMDLANPEMFILEFTPTGKITVFLTSKEVDELLSDAGDILDEEFIVPDEWEDTSEN